MEEGSRVFHLCLYYFYPGMVCQKLYRCNKSFKWACTSTPFSWTYQWEQVWPIIFFIHIIGLPNYRSKVEFGAIDQYRELFALLDFLGLQRQQTPARSRAERPYPIATRRERMPWSHADRAGLLYQPHWESLHANPNVEKFNERIACPVASFLLSLEHTAHTSLAPVANLTPSP